MNYFIFLFSLSTILLYVQTCRLDEKRWKTSTTHASPVAGPIIQFRTNSNFTFQTGLYHDNKTSSIIFVDRYRASFNKYFYKTGQVKSCYIKELDGQELVFAYPIKDEVRSYIVGANSKLYKLKYTSCNAVSSSGDTKYYRCEYTLAEKINMPVLSNESISYGHVDHNGAIIIGTRPNGIVTNNSNSRVFHVNLQTIKIKEIDSGYGYTGGITLYANRDLYVADMTPNVIYHYTYNAQDGTVSNKKLIFDLNNYKNKYVGRITGITVTNSGKLWIAFVGARMVFLYNPSTMNIDEVLYVPATVTNDLVIGGAHYSTLYLGSGNIPRYVDVRAEPQAGAMYSAAGTNTRGTASFEVYC